MDREIDMDEYEAIESVSWKKWVGEYSDRLSAPSKSHLSEDGRTTLCGKAIPTYAEGYEVDWDAGYKADCKKCNKAQ